MKEQPELNFERAAEIRDVIFEIRAMGKKWAPSPLREAQQVQDG